MPIYTSLLTDEFKSLNYLGCYQKVQISLTIIEEWTSNDLECIGGILVGANCYYISPREFSMVNG